KHITHGRCCRIIRFFLLSPAHPAGGSKCSCFGHTYQFHRQASFHVFPLLLKKYPHPKTIHIQKQRSRIFFIYPFWNCLTSSSLISSRHTLAPRSISLSVIFSYPRSMCSRPVISVMPPAINPAITKAAPARKSDALTRAP